MDKEEVVDGFGGTTPPAHLPEYKSKPCACGYIPENNPEKFELDKLPIPYYEGNLIKINIYRCIDCREIATNNTIS